MPRLPGEPEEGAIDLLQVIRDTSDDTAPDSTALDTVEAIES